MDKAIKKIVLDLGGKEITLTPKQAQNLKTALDDLFGQKVIHEYVPNPYPVVIREPYPYWRWDEPSSPWRDRVWCSSSGNVSFENDTMTLSLTG